MCDACSDFLQLLVNYENQVCQESSDQPNLSQHDVDTIFEYIQTWPSRQCMCCYRDAKNLDRFSYITQSLIYMVTTQLKALADRGNDRNEEDNAEKKTLKEQETSKKVSADKIKDLEVFERDKLLLLVSKIFQLNFPLYVAYKHTIQVKLDEITQQEMQSLNIFCDLHDSEIPIYLLKNVSWFCKMGGILAMTNCFTQLPSDLLPVSTAHGMLSIVCNLKLWLNYKSMVSMLVPLRSCVLRYMCRLSDQDLRTPTIKSMADFMWNAIKDPLDPPSAAFDLDGLELAFKYFTSTTLTMRLAGIAQINSQIGALADACVGEAAAAAAAAAAAVAAGGGSLATVLGGSADAGAATVGCVGSSAPHRMADWLIKNGIVSHIFGPNLHVEVIKQSHIILNFLAMEGRITCEHMDIIWSAAQLKHCSKPVHDLLPGLVKHLAAAPTLHLYNLLSKLEPKEHTEQTLYLASALIKSIWSRGGAGCGSLTGGSIVSSIGFINVAAAAAAASTSTGCGIVLHKCATSSENSVSLDPSNSEEEHGESSGQSDSGGKSDSDDIEDGIEVDEDEAGSAHHVIVDNSGPPRCKLPRKQDICNGSSTDTEIDGTSPSYKVAAATLHLRHHHKTKHHREQQRGPRIKKKLVTCSNALQVLPEGVEAIGSSSTSQEDEADVEDTVISSNLRRKRRKLLRRSRLFKRQKANPRKTAARLSGVDGSLSEVDIDSDHDNHHHHLHHHHHKKGTTADENDVLVVTSSHLNPLVHVDLQSKGDHETAACNATAASSNFITLHTRTGHILETLSGEEAEVEADGEGSYSSRMSNKSEKNMADFDGEDSVCDEELARLADHTRHVLAHCREKSPIRIDPRLSACFKADNVCLPGNTLLWDLLQDDKICQFGEGLALEAEKTLCNLICYTPDKEIRMKFIEGCLNNLSNNVSVVISLRMLPKLLSSFRGPDIHHVTQWAERQHRMTTHFFNNLKTYTAAPEKSLSLYTHQQQVQVRLHFLSAIFSPVVSPTNFKLSTDQVDTLWSCLAHDSECSDELFSWLLSQTKPADPHALRLDALRRLYVKHLPSLPPERFTMVGLTLFQQLCALDRVLIHQGHAQDGMSGKKGNVSGMDHMWKIALRAANTDVSMAAIQYINNYYMGQNLQLENEFVCQCMTHLKAASDDLDLNIGTEDSSLLCIQRALLLMKTHVETFRKRYAYHLRKWALEGKGIGSHSATLSDRTGTSIRLNVQSGTSSERCCLEMLSTDYIAELRAEIAKWCEMSQQGKHHDDNDNRTTKNNGNGDIWIRIITQGQEITIDCDEKTLAEMGFKDNQMIYISAGVSSSARNAAAVASAAKRRSGGECVGGVYSDAPPSAQSAPPRECLPTLLLLRPQHFERLFKLMQQLSSIRIQTKGGRHLPHTKAQVLSRRVWDILSQLPTSPKLLTGFKQLDVPLSELLDPSSAQKLMYSLFIVESLSCRSNQGQGGKYTTTEIEEPPWVKKFVQHGGLRHLLDIFMSGVLQRDGGNGIDWQQDCLASLLKILCHLGVEPLPQETRPSRIEKIVIPNINESFLSLIEVKSTMAQLTSILEEASLPRDQNHYKTGFWGRSQVVHYAMALLVSWLHCREEARVALFESPNFGDWLRRLVLEDPEPAVRREVCSAIYRLCLGVNSIGEPMESSFIAPLLSQLLTYLDKAESMRPQKLEVPEEGKEPYGPACRDYFWLVSRLVDSLPEELVKESIEDPQNCVININELTEQAAKSFIEREYLETRHRTVDDDGLIGLLNLLTNLLKHRPPFQTSKSGGQELLSQVFDALFALPNARLRHVPKCKSARSRTAAFDLLVELVKGCPQNYELLREKLLRQHMPGPHSPYPWDYWPHEDGRSECGYVGLTNLGATCYMASCMQHLYMMPQTRACILSANTEHAKHEPTLKELQRMFAYLLESERKAYNPRSFCKVYTMDHQPLNTAEQKDMAEFFIDLVSKLEEMTPTLKEVIKNLFCGVISNNVVSLDCEHVSRTLEEFYTVRCQVADMRNLYESLDEVTVKDTLEGDNMYTCSQCGKKVRAEKRACFKKLPHILCFNTMRYTFNMLTMLKEKVNTHFSFPLRLNMSGYVEKQLMPQRYQEEKLKNSEDNETEPGNDEDSPERYEYDLIGVTVHTGTADGGHYYSFIKDRTAGSRDKWFLFNDAEVKPFDPNQIAAECFGGEMTSKTYDSVTDKFMDFSFEKTNSAYMLFYERSPGQHQCSTEEGGEGGSTSGVDISDGGRVSPQSQANGGGQYQGQQCAIELSKELEDWIWQDNMHFIQDKNIFEHTYFNFMWQICGYIPQTILPLDPDVTRKAAQLSTSFFIETFIHAKEKPTMVQWVELVTKQFNACQEACQWFLEHMAKDTWWPVQVLLKCPNQMVRQMFQRLCIHVIQRLKQQSQNSLYLDLHTIKNESTESKSNEDNSKQTVMVKAIDADRISNASCVTKFLRTLLSLMEHGAKAHLKHLTEYFGFLYEFSKMGEEESKFLLSIGSIHTMVHFYLGQKSNDFVDVSEGEEEEEVVTLPTDKYKPASLDKMITLVASLVEKSRDSSGKLQLSEKDYAAVAGGKGFAFLYQQIKDNINPQQTKNLIHSLCRGNSQLAQSIICMISQAISRHSEGCQPFFKLLTLLTESSGGHTYSHGGHTHHTQGGPSTAQNNTPTAVLQQQPCFTQLVLQKVWDAAECCPYSALDWLALQVTRNRLVHSWVLNSMDSWLEHFLIAHNNQRVRNTAAYLLVSLVPSASFRQGFRAAAAGNAAAAAAAAQHRQQREPQLSQEAQSILHQIYTALLRLLPAAKHYTDAQQHGTMKLTAYFALLMYCCISRTEKLIFGQYFIQLWHLFHPKLSEPSIPAYHNKQALLAFWNHVCTDCPENVQLMLQNAHITKNIAFNYIFLSCRADHDDQEIVMYNRAMLPAYYGILRMMCQQSRVFTRHLAQHQNLQWAFKNITPHPNQYPQAVEELFKLMQLMVLKHPDATEAEQREIYNFRKTTLMTFIQCLDGRTSWGTLISAFRVLLETSDDKLYVVYNGGLQIVFECFQNLHVMLHEANSCHVLGDMLDILAIMADLLQCIRMFRDTKDARGIVLATKDWLEVLRKLATLLNTYNPQEIRNLAIEVLKELVVMVVPEAMQILAPLLAHCHAAMQQQQHEGTHNHGNRGDASSGIGTAGAAPLGPYFPRRGCSTPTPSAILVGKGGTTPRPLRPMVQMTVPHGQLDCSRGVDPEYDLALDKFFTPYHDFIDMMFRLAVNNESVPEVLINLSAVIGYEAVPLHSTYFPKLWLDIYKAQNIDRKYINLLTSCNYFVDYVDAILLDERAALTVDIIYEFLSVFFPKVSGHVLTEQTLQLIDNTVMSLSEQVSSLDIVKVARRLAGDMRALVLVYSSPEATAPPPQLKGTLRELRVKTSQEIEKLKPSAIQEKLNRQQQGTNSEENAENSNKEVSTNVEDEASSSKSEDSVNITHQGGDSVKSDSDSEMQTSSSRETVVEPNESQRERERCSTPIHDLHLLNKTISELIEIVQKVKQ